jgi:hypothetical protein
VSLFYTFYGEAELTSGDLQNLVATAVGGTVSPTGTIFCDGMNITAHHVDHNDDDDSTGKYFGFEERITATFNFDNLATLEVRDRDIALMVVAVLAILDASPGRGVLLFNGDRAILQRLDDDVEFDSDWDDWSEVSDVAPLVARHVVRLLNQPLL